MSPKLKHKRDLLTDEEIEKYCESVEKLLTDISSRGSTRKRKKVDTTGENNFSSENDNQLLTSRN